MAVTKILARRARLDVLINYVLNGDKTDDRILTSYHNVTEHAPYLAMKQTKIDAGKTDGVQCYHIIQSFAPGEIWQEQALEIAQQFCQKHLWGYEAVIGVHVDKEHVHAHIAFNSVNKCTRKKYHSNAKTYYEQIRGISDRLCRKYGLSVIMRGESSQAVTYAADKVQEGIDTAARKTGDAAADAASKVRKQISRRIKTRDSEVDAPGEARAESETPKGSENSKGASREQVQHQSTESGKRRVQQIARERRSLRNARGMESESKPLTTQRDAKTAFKGAVKTAEKSVKSTKKTVKATGKSIKTAKKVTKTAAKTAKQTVKAAERAVKAAKVAAKATAQATKATAKAVATTLKLAIAAAKGLIGAIAAGGWVVVAMVRQP